MGNEIVQAKVAGLPAELASILGSINAGYDEFSGGVTSGFPVISYRGRTWRVKQGGEEQIHLNEDQEAVQSIEVILIKSSETLSKTFYEVKYNEGDQGPPRCWSAGGVRPDSNVQFPISATCAACPNNVWGSKITEAGKKTRACQDVRRVAVMFSHDLEALVAGEKESKDCPVLLLRVPPATLGPLKEFVEHTLKPKGIPPFALVTKIGFDTDVSYPKLTFKGKRFLNGPELQAVVGLREDDTVKRILNESAEHDASGITESPSDPVPGATAQAKAPGASPKKTAVEEEEMNFSDPIEPANSRAKPARAAHVEEASAEEAEEVDIAPAPPVAVAPKPARKRNVAAKKATPAPAAPPPPAPAGDDYEALLNSILG